METSDAGGDGRIEVKVPPLGTDRDVITPSRDVITSEYDVITNQSNETSEGITNANGDENEAIPKLFEEKQIIVMMHSAQYVKTCNLLTRTRGRATLLTGLLDAYLLLPKMRIVEPKPSSKEDLLKFHSEDFIECLKRVSKLDYDIEKYDEELEGFGLCYDCPAFPGVFEYASLISGATVRAAEELNLGNCRVAVNWFGGWHHAKKDEADGYCYLNDIVLGILKLREKYERVLYIDLDLHHGDGVENAFYATGKVLTWSIHKLSPGFFPGTGKLHDVGYSRGKFYTVNTPLLDGIDDQNYFRIFQRIACKLREQFSPKAVVIQCGADGLATDPCNSFNLTNEVLGKCLKLVLEWKLPTLVLGGGGYNLPDTAKCWTYLTSIILDENLEDEIPEHEYLMKYGPDYSLTVSAGNRTNENTENFIESLIEETLDNLDEICV